MRILDNGCPQKKPTLQGASQNTVRFLGQYQSYNNITINYERSFDFAAISYSKNADIA